MASVKLTGVSLRKNQPKDHAINLQIPDGEFIALIGSSGSGVDDLIRILAGLSKNSGEIFIGGRKVNNLGPNARDVSMVFSEDALFDNLSVHKNIGLGLRMSRISDDECTRRILETARDLDISHLLDKMPATLTIGEKQEVAVARAIVRHPKVFLYDHPLKTLGTWERVRMRSVLARVHRKLKKTVIYATDDQSEAMSLADRVILMKSGHIEQIGLPYDLYHSPKTRYAASMMSMSPMGFAPTSILPASIIPHGAVLAGFRPERLRIGSPKTSDVFVGKGQVVLIEPHGSRSWVHVELNRTCWLTIEVELGATPPYGADVDVGTSLKDIFFFDNKECLVEGKDVK